MTKGMAGRADKKWGHLTAVGVLVLSALLCIVDVASYLYVRNRQIQMEQGQLLTMARTIGTGLYSYLDQELEKLDLFFGHLTLEKVPSKASLKEMADTFVADSRGLYRGFVLVKEGEVLSQEGDFSLEHVKAASACEDAASILTKYQADTGWYEMVVGRTVPSGEGSFSLLLAMDLNRVYEKIVSPVHIGEGGYSVVKDENLAIIMHHAKSQIGMDALYDREERYPQLDLRSLKQWLERQEREEEGVGILDSYIWDDPKLSPVRRLVAYTTIDIHGERWIVNSTLPISELSGPLGQMMALMGGWTLLYGVLLGLLLVAFTRSAARQKALGKEISYLKEINEGLELISRKNEEIRHYQRVQSLGLMSSHIAHEFNNYLTPVMVYGEILEGDSSIGEENQEMLREMLRSVEQAATLSRDLLDFSRMDTGGEHKPINLTEEVREALLVVRQLIPKKIFFKEEASEESAWLLGREGMAQHILMNLCKNAFQALEDAPVKELSVSYEVGEEKACLVVSDTGCGIGEENLRSIFEPFYTTKGSRQGTGLGLSVVRNIVEGVGGSIEVKSEKGKGTSFSLTFPVSLSPEGLQDRGFKEGGRILCLRPSSNALSSWEGWIHSLPGSVEYCEEESTVVARLQEEKRWEMLVVPEQLKEMSGIELAQIVRRFQPQIRIVLLAQRESEHLLWYVNNRVIDEICLPKEEEKDIKEP